MANIFGLATQQELQTFLEELIDPYKVYFQPPASLKMTYPCIVFKFDNIQTEYADSIKYKNKARYSITLISKSPVTDIPNQLLNLDYCSLDQVFISDNLNHYVFTLYY